MTIYHRRVRRIGLIGDRIGRVGLFDKIPVSIFQHTLNFYNLYLWTGSRESALMHAFGSSAIAFTLAKYCSKGLIANCQCAESDEPEGENSAFEWSGCSENVVNSVAFAEAFMKSWDLKSWRSKRHTETQRKGVRWRHLTKILTNLRNNEAGTNVSVPIVQSVQSTARRYYSKTRAVNICDTQVVSKFERAKSTVSGLDVRQMATVILKLETEKIGRNLSGDPTWNRLH